MNSLRSSVGRVKVHDVLKNVKNRAFLLIWGRNLCNPYAVTHPQTHQLDPSQRCRISHSHNNPPPPNPRTQPTSVVRRLMTA
jgi:hypothetical protein